MMNVGTPGVITRRRPRRRGGLAPLLADPPGPSRINGAHSMAKKRPTLESVFALYQQLTPEEQLKFYRLQFQLPGDPFRLFEESAERIARNISEMDWRLIDVLVSAMQNRNRKPDQETIKRYHEIVEARGKGVTWATLDIRYKYEPGGAFNLFKRIRKKLSKETNGGSN
jgi:hypothetical protein